MHKSLLMYFLYKRTKSRLLPILLIFCSILSISYSISIDIDGSSYVMAQLGNRQEFFSLEEAAKYNFSVPKNYISLPLGEWNVNVDGLHGTLNITSLNSEGRLNGSMHVYPFSNHQTNVTGYYDEDTGKMAFIRSVGPTWSDIEVYTGYRLRNVLADCIFGISGPGGCDQHAVVVGTFDSFLSQKNDTNTNVDPFIEQDIKNTFGWYASHIPEPCPYCFN